MTRFRTHLGLWLFCGGGLFAFLNWSCFIDPFSLENRQCIPKSQQRPGEDYCLAGWVCDFSRNVCVRPEQIQQEAKPTEKSQEIAAEPVQEQVADAGTEIVDRAEPVAEREAPEPVVEAAPDQGPQLQCTFSRASKASACPRKTLLDCELFSKDKGQRKDFALHTTTLPSGLAGSVAVSNASRRPILTSAEPKDVFIYLLGGGAGGKAGKGTWSTAVGKDGQLAGWKKLGELRHARTGASAFLIRGYLYVVGGAGADSKAVPQIERAQLLTGGRLGSFQDVGQWQGARTDVGIAYAHGYFYFVGGKENDGAVSAKVERALLEPNGRLGTVTTLKPLPKARTGQLIQSKHFLFMLSTGSGLNTLIAPLDNFGEIKGWCETTALPSEIQRFQALGDERRLWLLGVKTAKGLDARPYFNVMESGANNRVNPLGGSLDSWGCGEDGTKKYGVRVAREKPAVVMAREFLFVIGGLDSSGKALNSSEFAPVAYRADASCDMDQDEVTNNFDFCMDRYTPKNKNTDHPKANRPGLGTWVERMGRGDLCEGDMMVLVPGGEFTRGSDKDAKEKPESKVRLSAFYIDATEVTNADYAVCVTKGACTAPSKTSAGSLAKYYGEDQYKNFPVVHVTWEQAQKYCAFRGKRLPTEAEWEKAARGLNGNIYPWGAGAVSCTRVNYGDCKKDAPVGVGTLTGGRSLYGVFEMSGNVREWVADFFDAQYYSKAPKEDPPGPVSGQSRAIRGGSYRSAAASLRAAARSGALPSTQTADLGFRCALTLFAKSP